MDLLHILLRPILVALLLAAVSGISIAVRKRKVAKAEASAPAPVEDHSQALLRQAQQYDYGRDALAQQGQQAEALAQAQASVNSWHQLTQVRPGRFQAELHAASTRLQQLQATTGHV
ncbi:hypothetical protein [Amycolatopsis benzoatilytica]|uniref:hypothetical protein n=1 Tax=Amycolatopsis benzoatilytica TaxID=346045 RepID=UPI000379048C|nr:hypothetical protein [Amycolatopsis benzoatilytica]